MDRTLTHTFNGMSRGEEIVQKLSLPMIAVAWYVMSLSP